MKNIGRLLGVELAMISFGFILLVLVYLIPEDAMEYHIQESVKIFEEEGT